MKKVIGLIILAFVLTTNYTFSQSNKLDVFEGTWQYKSKDSIFTVILKKVQVNGKKYDKDMPDINADALIGWYELILKGKVVSSNTVKKRNTFDYDKKDHPLWGYSNKEEAGFESSILMYLNHKVPVWFKIFPSGNQALWQYTEKALDTPQNAILTRIK